MENIGIFLVTIFSYTVFWILSDDAWDGIDLRGGIKRMAIVALLVLPLNINGDVFTIAGNATAEKSVYSLLSLYQRAGQNAATVFGLAGYQQAGRDAETVFGLAGYQQAGRDAMTIIGLAGYQVAEKRTVVGVAIALYQRVGEKTRAFGTFSALFKD